MVREDCGMKTFYTAAILLTVGAMLIMQMSVRYNVILDRERRWVTQVLFGVIIVTSLCEWAGVMLDGVNPRCIPLHWLVKVLELSLTPCIGLICGRSLNRDDWLERFGIVVVVVHALLEIGSIFTGSIFYVDARNVYHHGPCYWVYMAACLFTIGIFFVRSTQALKRYQHSGGALIWFITLYLVAGILVQEINSTIKITWLTVGISAIMLYKVYGDVIQQVDGLTELINRLGYENYLSRFQGKGAILFLDTDHFKEVNDTYGHAAGDACLKAIAGCIRKTFSPYGKCFRVGGDEFCVVLEKRTEEVGALLERFAAEMAACRAGMPILPQVSIGCTEFDTALKNINDAVKEADDKMYTAKKRARETADPLRKN